MTDPGGGKTAEGGDRWLGGRVGCSVLAGVAAAPLFVLSSFLMARAAASAPEHAAYMRTLAADVDSIRELAEGRVIFFSGVAGSCGKRRHWRAHRRYYFTGSVFTRYADRRLADFVVGERIEGARSLTPGNRWLFLYYGARSVPDSVRSGLAWPESRDAPDPGHGAVRMNPRPVNE